MNEAASQQQIKTGAPVAALIQVGSDAYAAFSSGKLYLKLITGYAWVVACDNAHLFYMEDPYSTPELRAFALAAQSLRQPLCNAMSGTDLLLQDSAFRENTAHVDRLAQINHSLYQLMRTICNMSDISQLGLTCNTRPELLNASAVFDEIFEKAAALAKDAGRILQFHGLRRNVDCVLDRNLLERAILNLISNAIKFSPADSTVKATFKQGQNSISLTVENRIKDSSGTIFSDAFHRFLREPGLESAQNGIGLGMAVVSAAASIHSGTVLIQAARKDTARITMSIPIQTVYDAAVRSPLILLEGYSGGIDNYLIELSEILPDPLYRHQ